MQAQAKPDIRSTLQAALAAHKAGDFTTAETKYRAVLQLSPDEFDALSLLGTLLSQKGDVSSGLNYLQKALAMRPESLNGLLNTGLALQKLERPAKALEIFERGLKLKSDSPDFLRGKALALYSLNSFEDAIKCYERMAAKRVSTKDDDINHGVCLYELSRFEEALVRLRRANAADPQNASLIYNIGRSLLKLGLLDAALAALDASLKIEPVAKKTLIAKAEAAREMNNSALALETIEKVLELEPENSFARGLKASTLLDLGQKNEAAEIFRSLALRNEMIGDALQGLAQCKTYKTRDRDADLILEGLKRLDLEPGGQSLIHFGASKCLNDLGQYDEALMAAADARRLRPKTNQKNYNFTAIAKTFNRQKLESIRVSGDLTSQPLFVVGMPRSGTSLLEQIIASHPQAHGAGELRDMIRIATRLGALEADSKKIEHAMSLWTSDILSKASADYLRVLRRSRGDALRIVDKMPHNFMLVGAISILLPNARFIHSKRDPADTCVSIFMNDLKGNHGYADDLESLGKYYRAYERLMAHWESILGNRIFVNSYEETVKNPEREIRKLLDFAGLPWDEKCLSFFTTDRSVTTLSRAQVREPMYLTSIGRWKKYERHLGTLLAALQNGR